MSIQYEEISFIGIRCKGRILIAPGKSRHCQTGLEWLLVEWKLKAKAELNCKDFFVLLLSNFWISLGAIICLALAFSWPTILRPFWSSETPYFGWWAYERLLILDVSPVMPALLSGISACSHPCFLYVAQNRTATVFGWGHRSRTLLATWKFLSFLHHLENVLPVLSAFLRISILALFLRYLPRQLSSFFFKQQLLDSICCCYATWGLILSK